MLFSLKISSEQQQGMESQVWQEGTSGLAASNFTAGTESAGSFHRQNRNRNVCDCFWNEQPESQQNKVLHQIRWKTLRTGIRDDSCALQFTHATEWISWTNKILTAFLLPVEQIHWNSSQLGHWTPKFRQERKGICCDGGVSQQPLLFAQFMNCLQNSSITEWASSYELKQCIHLTVSGGKQVYLWICFPFLSGDSHSPPAPLCTFSSSASSTKWYTAATTGLQAPFTSCFLTNHQGRHQL